MSTLRSPALPAIPPPDAPSKPSRGGLFRAFWRWHFYSSFLVIPILLMLSLTGLIYLFRFSLEPMLHADLMRTTAPATSSTMLALEPQRAAISRAHPDAEIGSITEPKTAKDTTRFSITKPDGSARDVFVDPWRGTVLGDLDPNRTISGLAIRLHGDLMVGLIGDAVIELGSCWAIVMTITGLYMFWRGRSARTRRRARGAVGASLRSRHAMTGVIVAGGLLLLVVSGLPWTGLWGAKVQQLVTASGSSLWSLDPGAQSDPASRMDESMPHSHDVPWAQGAAPVPSSNADSATAAATGDKSKRSVANVDTAVAVASREGLAHPMTVALPAEDTGVFSVMGYAFNDPGRERTVHVDRFSGNVVSEYGYADYPVLAKTVSQGIALHEGRRFGAANMWATTAFCVAVIFLCISGPMMWWRRRPKGEGKNRGRVGAPRGRLPLRSTPVLVVGVSVLAVLLPLFGLSLLLVLLVDRFVLRRFSFTRQWFDVTG